MKSKPSHIKAGIAAKNWLHTVEVTDDDMAALRDRGLLLCERVLGGLTARPGESETRESVDLDLPQPAALIPMMRSDLLDISQRIRSAPARVQPVIATDKPDTWARVIGGLALSYAQTNDLEAVAALLVLAAHLNLDSAWIAEARSFLLEQQQPSGCFGLLASESVVIANDGWTSYMALKLTVAALSALAIPSPGRAPSRTTARISSSQRTMGPSTATTRLHSSTRFTCSPTITASTRDC
jgi:hypothetical protein